MKMFNTIIFTVLLSIVLGSIIACQNNQVPKDLVKAENASLESSNTWMKIIDEENYSKSWDDAATLFKNSIKKEQWIDSLKSTRKAFGKMLQREIKSKDYKTSLPGVPDGEYMILTFKTSFENKKDSIETITVMKEINDSWKVVGYFIK